MSSTSSWYLTDHKVFLVFLSAFDLRICFPRSTIEMDILDERQKEKAQKPMRPYVAGGWPRRDPGLTSGTLRLDHEQFGEDRETFLGKTRYLMNEASRVKAHKCTVPVFARKSEVLTSMMPRRELLDRLENRRRLEETLAYRAPKSENQHELEHAQKRAREELARLKYVMGLDDAGEMGTDPEVEEWVKRTSKQIRPKYQSVLPPEHDEGSEEDLTSQKGEKIPFQNVNELANQDESGGAIGSMFGW